MKVGDVLVLAALAFILFLAVAAIIRGYSGIKKCKSFDIQSKKVKIAYLLTSTLHMLAGTLITLCYVIAGVLILVNYPGGQ